MEKKDPERILLYINFNKCKMITIIVFQCNSLILYHCNVKFLFAVAGKLFCNTCVRKLVQSRLAV